MGNRSRVALTRRDTRRETVLAALEGVDQDIDLGEVRHVLVKPNFVNTNRQLAATHADAVDAVLEFVRSRYDGRITIGEGPAASPAGSAFESFGYAPIAERHRAELVDLNADSTVPVEVYDRRLRPLCLKLARTAVEADYRIVVGPPKTHDTVVVTLAIKNMVMGALVNPGAPRNNGHGIHISDDLIRWVPVWLQHSRFAEFAKRVIAGAPGGSSKMAMHQSIPVINLNLALVASAIWPQLVVIDGWEGMEGAGPTMGDPVEWRLAHAGTDALAVDVLTAYLMGFDPNSIGYLQYCGDLGLGVRDLSRVDVVGDLEPAAATRSFTPHPGLDRQLAWQMKDVGGYLRRIRVMGA